MSASVGLVDVHTHLTHEKFRDDVDQVVRDSIAMGLAAIVVNGLNPDSNRMTLVLAERYPEVKAALGIYPLDAINHRDDLPFPIERFSVADEIKFIESMAEQNKIIAIGECGLDGHWVGESTFAEQEAVFEALIDVAKRHNLPLIIHSRKREVRTMEILKAYGVTRADFHCFGGRTKHAVSWAETHGWYFSIPANAKKNEAFQSMLRSLPLDRILTETDAPYLGPEKDQRNFPGNVRGTVELLAEIRGMSFDDAKRKVWANYQDLFNPQKSEFAGR